MGQQRLQIAPARFGGGDRECADPTAAHGTAEPHLFVLRTAERGDLQPAKSK